MRDVDSAVFRPVAERRTRLWAWRVPGWETLGEAGTQSLATSQDHPPIPHLLWGCPAPPPGPVPQLGGSGGGDPPSPNPSVGTLQCLCLASREGSLPGSQAWGAGGGAEDREANPRVGPRSEPPSTHSPGSHPLLPPRPRLPFLQNGCPHPSCHRSGRGGGMESEQP